jgi:tetratricopeptide (TPR) repeat protein
MSKRSLLRFSVFGSLAFVACAASAQEAITVLGTSPIEACANLAAKASSTGTASYNDLLTCNDAVHWAHATSNELAPAMINRAVLYIARGEYTEAIADLDIALAMKPTLADGFNDRGAAHWALHQNDAAKADFTRALALQPSHPERVYFNRALAYEDSGDLKQAFLDFSKAAEIDPSWDKPAKELARFSVGRARVS